MWCRCVEDVEAEVEHASALLTHERDESTLRRLKAALNGVGRCLTVVSVASSAPSCLFCNTRGRWGGGGERGGL
eukprot:COSAG01_NODE_25736_length_735_cov_0.806604_2_plen_74_part_00